MRSRGFVRDGDFLEKLSQERYPDDPGEFLGWFTVLQCQVGIKRSNYQPHRAKTNCGSAVVHPLDTGRDISLSIGRNKPYLEAITYFTNQPKLKLEWAHIFN